MIVTRAPRRASDAGPSSSRWACADDDDVGHVALSVTSAVIHYTHG